MDEFNLEKFLENYKPKNLNNILKPYLKLKKLKMYKLLNEDNKSELKIGKTYIKFISHEEGFKDEFYEDHIRYGGILIGYGTFIDGKYVNLKEESEKSMISHLKLKNKIIVETKRKEKTTKDNIYIISLKNNYVFYKVVLSLNDEYRNFFVELRNQ